MSADLVHIAESMRGLHAADLAVYDAAFLGRSLRSRMQELRCVSIDAYAGMLEEDAEEYARFVRGLGVSYSAFFRNPLTFVVLERLVLPRLQRDMEQRARKSLRVWSAACAAGQEPYSLAILMDERGSAESGGLPYRIFATDRSEEQIALACAGQYSSAALRQVTMQRVESYFGRSGDVYTVREHLKDSIEFSVFDLLDTESCCPPGSIYGDFDVIFCANLLMYHTAEIQLRILEKFSHCLAAGGCLIAGETERNILSAHRYREVYPHSAIFQR
jgi:chemotaxis protein methyltransferase CheR